MIEGLLQGSYKGAQFFLESSRREGGRKTLIHTFPNSDTSISEDLGLAPLSFSMRIIVAQNMENRSVLLKGYYESRDAMIEKLEDGEEGILVHPFWGNLNVVTEGPYSIVETINRIGRAVITQRFTQVGNLSDTTQSDQFFPTETSKEGITEDVKNVSDEMITKYSASNSFKIGGIKASTVIMDSKEEIADKFVVVSENIQDADDLSEFNVSINKFRNISISQSAEYVQGIADLFFDALGFIEDAEDAYSAFQDFFDYKDDITTEATTPALSDVLNNELAFRSIVQNLGSAYASEASVNIDFATDENLLAVESVIEAQLSKIADNEVDDSTVYALLQTLKVHSNVVYSEELLQVARVKTVNVVNSSLTNLVYDYYGNLDNYDLIRDLNSFDDPSRINGAVKIVTEN